MWKLLTIIRRNTMPPTAIHPGEHLAEELKELGMSAAELARQLDVPTNRVTEILNGRRAITGDTALRLAHFFGTTAEFWLNLQSLYELRVAQKKAGKSIRGLPTLKRLEQAPA
jgi:addiction module HigA family antidote